MTRSYLSAVSAILFSTISGSAADREEHLISEGLKAYKEHHLEEAIASYSAAIKINPNNTAAYNNRGLAFAAGKEFDKALADFSKALRIKPDWASYYNRGIAYDAKGDAKAAIADLSKAIEKSPPNTIGRIDSLVARAHCYFNQEKSDPAMGDLNAAIKIGVKEADPYVLRGILHKIDHHYDRSLADYQKALALEPNSPRVYEVAAYLLAVCPMPKYRNGTKAVAYATKACELGKWQDARSVETLATAYAETGNFDEAIRWQKKAIAIDKGAIDPKRLALFEQKQPMRDMNRREEPVANLTNITDKVAIGLGKKVTVQLEVGEKGMVHPRTGKGEKSSSALQLDFHVEKAGHVLLLQHRMSAIVQARCLARLRDYDTYFETDILPIPNDRINRELWSEPIEELVLFGFKLKPVEDNDQAPRMSQREAGQYAGGW